MATDAHDASFEPALSASETWVGTNPDDASPVTLTDDDLHNTCYIQGNVPDQQTALCQRLCVQWAHAGRGFCYINSRGPELLDLLYALPASRLEDIVWIDLDRRDLSDHFDVPIGKRVCVEPLDGPDPTIDDIELNRGPITGRIADLMDVFSDTEHFDWNVATVLSALLSGILQDDDRTVSGESGVINRFLGAHLEGDFDELLTLVPDEDRQTVRVQLQRAYDHDPEVFRKARSLFGIPTDACQYYNPLTRDTTYSFAEGVAEDAIILVTGDAPHPSEPEGLGADIAQRTTRLLTVTIVRRLWEALQTRSQEASDSGSDNQAMYPLVVDGISELLSGDGSLFRELLSNPSASPLALVASGPAPTELPDVVANDIRGYARTTITFEANATEALERSLMAHGTAPLERALENETTSAFAEEPICWVQTNREGRLVDSRRQSSVEPTRPFGPVPRQRTDTEIETALVNSVERHGTDLSWPDEMHSGPA